LSDFKEQKNTYKQCEQNKNGGNEIGPKKNMSIQFGYGGRIETCHSQIGKYSSVDE
jgi:hypothetical protein